HVSEVQAKNIPAREKYGAIHSARMALWSQILAHAYPHKVENPKLLAAAAAFQSVAREDDGLNHWTSESAKLFELILENAGINKGERNPYLEVIEKVEPNKDQCSSDIERIIHDV